MVSDRKPDNVFFRGFTIFVVIGLLAFVGCPMALLVIHPPEPLAFHMLYMPAFMLWVDGVESVLPSRRATCHIYGGWITITPMILWLVSGLAFGRLARSLGPWRQAAAAVAAVMVLTLLFNLMLTICGFRVHLEPL